MRVGAGRRRHIVPAPGARSRRREGDAPGRAAAISYTPTRKVRALGAVRRLDGPRVDLAGGADHRDHAQHGDERQRRRGVAGAGVDRRRLSRRHAGRQGDRQLPDRSPGQPGRHHAALRHGPQQRHARPHRGAGGARLPRQRRRDSDHAVLHRARPLEHGARQHRHDGDHGADGHGGGDARGGAAVPDGADGRQRRAGRRVVTLCADRDHRQREHGQDWSRRPRDRDVSEQPARARRGDVHGVLPARRLAAVHAQARCS